MIKLNLIKYDNANALEATWIDVVAQPDTVVPANDEVLDENGEIITAANPEHIIKNEDKESQLRCIAYSDRQIDLLRADVALYGGSLSEYEALIADVLANQEPIVPPVQPTIEQLRQEMNCSPRQIRQALTAVGLRAAVEAAIAAGDQDIKDWYAFATEFQRMHPAVLMLASALSVPDAQLDSLFELAASL